MTQSELIQFRNFLLSVGAHLLLFFLAFQLWMNAPKAIDEPITVDVQYPQTTPHANRRALGAKAKTAHHEVRLNDIGMRSEAPQEETSEQALPGEIGGWDLENADPKIARFNLYVFQVVQRQLDMESRGLHNRLTGIVKMRLWFDEKGVYLVAQTRFEAIDSEFQAIVDRALRAAFSDPIPNAYLYAKKPFYIDREVYLRGTI